MENYIKYFSKYGFVLIKNLIPTNILSELKKKSSECIIDAEKGNWEHIKVYREYPFFQKKINVFGIDYPFSTKQGEDIFNLIKQINYRDIVCKFNNWINFETELVRLHSNSSFYNYQGAWHRDHNYYPSPEAIQSVIYLEDETGFKIVPKYNNELIDKYNFNTLSTDETNEEKNLGYLELPSNIYETISAKAGDVFFFEAGLLHQGFCKKKRIHYLLRHIQKDNLKSKDFFNFTKDNLPNADLSLINKKFVIRNDLFSKIKRLKVFILYFLPRFKMILFNFKRKKKYSIFHSTFWQ